MQTQVSKTHSELGWHAASSLQRRFTYPALNGNPLTNDLNDEDRLRVSRRKRTACNSLSTPSRKVWNGTKESTVLSNDAFNRSHRTRCAVLAAGRCLRPSSVLKFSMAHVSRTAPLTTSAFGRSRHLARSAAVARGVAPCVAVHRPSEMERSEVLGGPLS